jgi:hypothetical protein
LTFEEEVGFGASKIWDHAGALTYSLVDSIALATLKIVQIISSRSTVQTLRAVQGFIEFFDETVVTKFSGLALFALDFLPKINWDYLQTVASRGYCSRKICCPAGGVRGF